ncbi:MAG: glycosyltransferase family 9 protein [Candidatus Omnitrophica bacterium]|nr:glycosyltransferase family 9 protein [Candidatus Omnitrophota bacterium]
MEIKEILKKWYFLLRGIILSVFLRRRCFILFDKNKINKILVIRLDRIGDMVVSEPALRALRQAFPRANITVLTLPATAPLLKFIPWVDQVIIYRSFFDSIHKIRQGKFNLVVDLLMDYPIKTALLARFSASEVSAGFDISERGICFTIAHPQSKIKQKMYQHLLGLVEAIACRFGITQKIEEKPPQLFIGLEQKKFQQEYFRHHNFQGKLVIGIHPGAKFPSQRWGAERFSQLAEKILSANAKVIFLGSIGEKFLIKKIVSSMKLQPVVAMGLSLDKTIALISGINLLVCNNSGLLHIAAALGVATVSMMGPTDPILWAPASDNAVVIRKQLPCSPCNKAVCNRHLCLESITVEEVWQAIKSQIARLDYF